MTAPIKRGTARRLGLRPPKPRLELRFHQPMTEAEVEDFKAKLRDAMGRPLLLVNDPPPLDGVRWDSHWDRKPRPWWMFWRRG
jgi:hypothetical protein